MKILWEPLKDRALQEFQTRMTSGFEHSDNAHFLAAIAGATGATFESPLKIVADWKAYGSKLIESWDIRKAAKLIELFPSCLPSRLEGKPFSCDYDDNAEWALFFE